MRPFHAVGASLIYLAFMGGINEFVLTVSRSLLPSNSLTTLSPCATKPSYEIPSSLKRSLYRVTHCSYVSLGLPWVATCVTRVFVLRSICIHWWRLFLAADQQPTWLLLGWLKSLAPSGECLELNCEDADICAAVISRFCIPKCAWQAVTQAQSY